MEERLEKAREFARASQIILKSMLRKQGEPLQIPETGGPGLQLHNFTILSRVYIGSVHFELSETDIKDAFSSFGAVRSVSMSIDPATMHHKGFCFVEFDTPEAAALAIEVMNGAELGGRSLKVGRPVNFPTELPPGVPRPLPQRLYISNVHECVSESDVLELFSAFGRVSSVALVPDSHTRSHKGYGYIQFRDSSSAQIALVSLKGFKLGGIELRIGRTVVGGPFPEGMSALEHLPIKTSRPAPVQAPQPSAKQILPAAVLRALEGINASVDNKSKPDH